MIYNRDIVALAKERRLMGKANRDAVTKLILLINLYHSCEHRYFPSIEDKEAAKEEIKKEVKKTAKRSPTNIRNRVSAWLADRELWTSEVESLHSI